MSRLRACCAVQAPSGLAVTPRIWTCWASDGRDGVEQREQLGDVVAVAAGQGHRERDPMAVDDQVVLRARVATVDRGRPDVVPPFESMYARGVHHGAVEVELASGAELGE